MATFTCILISVSISTRKLHFEKLPFYPDGALGQPFGTCFEVHGEHLVPTTRTPRRFDFGKCLLLSYTLQCNPTCLGTVLGAPPCYQDLKVCWYNAKIK